MANVTVMRDVGNSLKMFLHKHVPELSDENAIVFDSPGELETSSSSTRLSLFLYKIGPNSALRNELPLSVGSKQKYPPLVADLHYIFTPYAQSRDTELMIIEKIMQLFHDHGVFRDDMLQGSLQGNGNNEIRVIPESLSLDDLNKLWGIFPNKPLKLSIAYIFTPVKIPSEKEKDIKKVEEKVLKINPTMKMRKKGI